MNRNLIFLLVALLPFTLAQGREDASLPWESESTSTEDQNDQDSLLTKGNTKIWLEKGAALDSQTQVVLLQTLDATKSALTTELLEQLTSIIRNRFEKAGIVVIGSEQNPAVNSVIVKPFVTKYAPGSAVGRWVSAGIGATTCIIRATIFHAKTDEVIGEIISWRQVDVGGLFSAGADKYVPIEAAEGIADAFVEQAKK